MQVLRIDHIAIAVETLRPVLDLLSFLGLKLDWQEELSDQGLRSSMVAADNAHIELLESVPDPQTRVMAIQEPVSRAGDRFAIRAEVDLLLAMSTCPMDVIAPTNAWRITPLLVEVFAG